MTAVLPQNVALGELAARLQADRDGSLQREYCEMFAAAAEEARKRLREPLTPEAFETNAALAESAELGAEVISKVWSALHP